VYPSPLPLEIPCFHGDRRKSAQKPEPVGLRGKVLYSKNLGTRSGLARVAGSVGDNYPPSPHVGDSREGEGVRKGHRSQSGVIVTSVSIPYNSRRLLSLQLPTAVAVSAGAGSAAG